jgi:hypothetical protein
MRLPAIGARAAGAAQPPPTWIVGAQRGAVSRRIARRFGARALTSAVAYRVATSRARALAGALRAAGTLRYAEPNGRLRRASALDAAPAGWARAALVEPGLAPPAPSPAATIAIVDDLVDTSLPDLQSNTSQLDPGPILGPHGTMVASAAAAVLNGNGVFGVFPGARLLSIGVPVEITCFDAANAILAAAKAKVRVINLSFGSPGDCATLFDAVQIAYASGGLVVASAGNDFAAGNPVIYPAAYPHVLSVAAIDPTGKPSGFSSENIAIDVAAPGVAVPLAIPLSYDNTDGVRDAITLADGTSFSAPMVAGAAAWLATARPSLTNGQLADVLRRSAIDVAAPGYDASTGFGLVQMGRALAQPTPARDVYEPNDGITFVDGSVFGKPDPFVWNGTGKRAFGGSVDRVEDPIDVYRIRLPRGASGRIRLRPRFGDPDLFVFRGNARSLSDGHKIIARSRRGARRTDSVTIVNETRRPRVFYVAVAVKESSSTLNADYVLEFRRVKRR